MSGDTTIPTINNYVPLVEHQALQSELERYKEKYEKYKRLFQNKMEECEHFQQKAAGKIAKIPRKLDCSPMEYKCDDRQDAETICMWVTEKVSKFYRRCVNTKMGTRTQKYKIEQGKEFDEYYSHLVKSFKILKFYNPITKKVVEVPTFYQNNLYETHHGDEDISLAAPTFNCYSAVMKRQMEEHNNFPFTYINEHGKEMSRKNFKRYVRAAFEDEFRLVSSRQEKEEMIEEKSTCCEMKCTKTVTTEEIIIERTLEEDDSSAGAIGNNEEITHEF